MVRRGSENIEKMTKSTFELKYDNEIGMAYVQKIEDEMTKNHQEVNNEIITGFMPQIVDTITGLPHKMCPVRSFENYVAHLNPESEMLWQVPLTVKHKNPDIWYSKKHIGHNTLDKFLRRITEKLDVTQVYTNHCIRVTGITKFTRSQFTAKQIMSVSGHKSLESLAIYQKVASDEKMMMGMSLTYSLLHPHDLTKVVNQQNVIEQTSRQLQIQEKNPILPLPALVLVERQQNTIQALVPFDPLQNENTTTVATSNETHDDSNYNFNLDDILSEFQDFDEDLMIKATQEAENVNFMTKSSKTTSLIKRNTNGPNMPAFSNCKIANININIYKQ